MEIYLFLRGLIIGFAIAAPVGPIAVLCIRRTLQFGRWSGFFSGLGAAVADSFYGAIAAFGLTFISDFLLAEKFWLRLIGGLFLVYLGARIFFSKTIEGPQKITHATLFKDFSSTFLLTITNPMTIISYAAVFAGVGLVNIQGHESYVGFLLLGVFLGSSCWWLFLSEGITIFRKKLTQNVMVWVNRSWSLDCCVRICGMDKSHHINLRLKKLCQN